MVNGCKDLLKPTRGGKRENETKGKKKQFEREREEKKEHMR
jgi:hypothetical protein